MKLKAKELLRESLYHQVFPSQFAPMPCGLFLSRIDAEVYQQINFPVGWIKPWNISNYENKEKS